MATPIPEPGSPDAIRFERIIDDLLARNFSRVEGFMPPGTTERLRAELSDLYDRDRFKKAAVGNQFNEVVAREIRGDFIYWLHDVSALPAAREFVERTRVLAEYLNRTCYLGIADAEFHYAVYPEGAFYKRHLDAFRGDDRRRLSLVYYLNPADWQEADGGELVIYRPTDTGEEKVIVTPEPGLLVLFESQVLEHEVLPARRERLSLTGWMKTR